MIEYANQGATRRLPLSKEMERALSFLPELGITAKVFSGGQPAKGSGLPRVGSTRHDHGNAADVFFYRDGRRLDWSNPDDLPLFQEIVTRGKQAGLTGFGAGDGYMQPGSMHIGFGEPAIWGAGGKGANAPDWLRSAYYGTEASGSQDIADDTMAVLGLPPMSSGQRAPAGSTEPRSTISTRGPEPMAEYQPEKASGLLGMLFPNMTADRQDRLVMGLSGMAMNPNRGLQEAAMGRMDERRDRRATFEQDRKQQEQVNKTTAYIENQVRAGNLPPELLEMARVDPVGALRASQEIILRQPEDNRTALMQNVEYIMQQNPEIPFDQALQMARSGTTINNNMGNSEFGTIPPGYELFTDEQGNRRMRPIAGGPAAREIELQERENDALGAARSTQQESKETTITRDVDRLVSMIDQGGLFNLPETGIVGGALGGLGVNQEAVDFKNTLAGIQSAVAFDRLQQMREASKTGGALGAVSERELDLLMSAYGALQQNTSGPMLKENLLTIKRIMTKIENDPVASRLYYGSSNQSNAASNGFSVTGRID